MIRLILIAALALSSFALSACNTVHGFGKDVEKAGEVISGAAK